MQGSIPLSEQKQTFLSQIKSTTKLDFRFVYAQMDPKPRSRKGWKAFCVEYFNSSASYFDTGLFWPSFPRFLVLPATGLLGFDTEKGLKYLKMRAVSGYHRGDEGSCSFKLFVSAFLSAPPKEQDPVQQDEDRQQRPIPALPQEAERCNLRELGLDQGSLGWGGFQELP